MNGEYYINAEGYLVWVADYHNAQWLVKVIECPNCKEWRGEMFCPSNGRTRPITCLCDGPVCHHCGRTKLHKPGTDIVTATLQIWYVPPFYGLLGCGDCVTAVLAGLLYAAPNASISPPPGRVAAHWQSRLESDEGGRNWVRYAENIRQYKRQSGDIGVSFPCATGWSCHDCPAPVCRVEQAITALSHRSIEHRGGGA